MVSVDKIKANKEKIAIYLLLFVSLIIIICNIQSLISNLKANISRFGCEHLLIREYVNNNFYIIDKLQENFNSFIDYWKHFLDPVTVEKKSLLNFIIEDIIFASLIALANFIQSVNTTILIFETILILLMILGMIVYLNWNDIINNFKITKSANVLLIINKIINNTISFLKKSIKKLLLYLRDFKRFILLSILMTLILTSNLSLIVVDIINAISNSLAYLNEVLNNVPEATPKGIYALGSDMLMFIITVYGKIAIEHPFLNSLLLILLFYLLCKWSIKRKQRKIKNKFINSFIRSDEEE